MGARLFSAAAALVPKRRGESSAARFDPLGTCHRFGRQVPSFAAPIGIIIATLCIATLGVVFLPAFGFPVEVNSVNAIITLFIGLVGTAVGWFFGTREGNTKAQNAELKGAVVAANLKADYAESLAEVRELKAKGQRN